jgi:hypothetical protein
MLMEQVFVGLATSLLCLIVLQFFTLEEVKGNFTLATN